MNEKVLKALKICCIVFTCICFITLVTLFVRGIYLSLFENDIKTAQNRIRSAYTFLYMLGAGLATLLGFVVTFKIKVRVLPKCIGKFLEIEEEA